MKCSGGRPYNILEAKGLDKEDGKEDEVVMAHRVCGWQGHFAEMGATGRRPGSVRGLWVRRTKKSSSN